jgi:hypothetical protein
LLLLRLDVMIPALAEVERNTRDAVMFNIPPELTPNYVKSNTSTLFIFGDSLKPAEIRGEAAPYVMFPNVFRVPVKIKPCMDEISFWDDRLYLDVLKDHLNGAYEGDIRQKIERMKPVNVVCDPTIGTSTWSGPLKSRAPKCYAEIVAFIKRHVTDYQVDYRMRAL